LRIRTSQAALALLLAAVVVLAAALVQRIDGGVILGASGWHLDPIGEAKLAHTRLTRNCGAVQMVPKEAARLAIEQSDLPERVRNATPIPRLAASQEGWLLVETDLTNLEPAILLLKSEAGKYTQAASYSGTAAPFNDTQVIHEYLQHEAVRAPKQLIKCYEPVGPPFAGLQR
jgi:hypothetical protein